MLQESIEPEQSPMSFPQWMRGLLLILTMYNIAWGLFMYYFPDAFYQWISFNQSSTSAFISYLGIIFWLAALIFFLVALYPLKYWYLIFLAVISKLIGDFWLYNEYMHPHTTKKFLFHILMNDLIWIIPLGIVALTAYKLKKNRPQ